MAILLLMLAVIVSIAIFFTLAIKFGNPSKASVAVFDLDSISRPTKEKSVMLLENPEDLIV
jgi:hypothetical protein